MLQIRTQTLVAQDFTSENLTVFHRLELPIAFRSFWSFIVAFRTSSSS